MLRRAAIVCAVSLLAVALGCGSSSTPATSSNNPNTPAFGGNNPGGNSGGGASTAPDTYVATWVFTNGHNTSRGGTITVNSAANNGAANVQITGGGLAAQT